MTGLLKEQAKVSMVMPCYNKVLYIAEMLDSIIAQKWDNIELILVNDGSTDGTLQVIEQYLPKLEARRFEVIVINQDNAGVCAAAKNGLSKISGDYVCLIDCDDELDSDYVYTAVRFLEENPEYDFTACHLVKYLGTGDKKTFVDRDLRPIADGCENVCEMYLMEQVVMTVWVYVVRSSYFRSCGIVESYFTDTKGSHEPGYVIPLTANNGRVKYFPHPLYRFNMNGEGHSRFTRFKQAENFYNEYCRLQLIAIERLGDRVDATKKERFALLSEILKFNNLLYYADKLSFNDQATYRKILNELNDFLLKSKLSRSAISYEHLRSYWCDLIRAIRSKVICNPANDNQFIRTCNRVIGYGALGKQARLMLPLINESAYRPTELWDQVGDGEKVKHPDFASLNSDDAVIVLTKSVKIFEEVKRQAGMAKVMVAEELLVPIIVSTYGLDVISD